jgi:hypothetical protein
MLAGLLAAGIGYAWVFLRIQSAEQRLEQGPHPELAWLKTEYHLNDADFASVVQLHDAYAPKCAELCRRIDEQNAKVQRLLEATNTVTAEIKEALVESARHSFRMRNCHAPALLRNQPPNATRTGETLSRMGPKRDPSPRPDATHKTDDEDARAMTFHNFPSPHNQTQVEHNMTSMKSTARAFLAIAAIAAMAGSAAFFTGCKHTDSAVHSSGVSAHKYTCEMHPEVASDMPGKCPKCGMDLTQK